MTYPIEQSEEAVEYKEIAIVMASSTSICKS